MYNQVNMKENVLQFKRKYIENSYYDGLAKFKN